MTKANKIRLHDEFLQRTSSTLSHPHSLFRLAGYVIHHLGPAIILVRKKGQQLLARFEYKTRKLTLWFPDHEARLFLNGLRVGDGARHVATIVTSLFPENKGIVCVKRKSSIGFRDLVCVKRKSAIGFRDLNQYVYIGSTITLKLHRGPVLDTTLAVVTLEDEQETRHLLRFRITHPAKTAFDLTKIDTEICNYTSKHFPNHHGHSMPVWHTDANVLHKLFEISYPIDIIHLNLK